MTMTGEGITEEGVPDAVVDLKETEASQNATNTATLTEHARTKVLSACRRRPDIKTRQLLITNKGCRPKIVPADVYGQD